MLGYSGDDLAVFLAFIALSAPCMIEGIKSKGRERLYWWGPATILALMGFFWHYIKGLSPKFAAVIISVATNPETWFVLSVAGLFLLVNWRERIRDRANPAAPRRMSGEISDQEVELHRQIEARFGGVQRGLESVWNEINLHRATIEELKSSKNQLPHADKTELMKRRRTLLKDARDLVARLSESDPDDGGETIKHQIATSRIYFDLRPFLNPNFDRSLYGRNYGVIVGQKIDPTLDNLLRELERLQKDWGIDAV